MRVRSRLGRACGRRLVVCVPRLCGSFAGTGGFLSPVRLGLGLTADHLNRQPGIQSSIGTPSSGASRAGRLPPPASGSAHNLRKEGSNTVSEQ